MTPRLCPVSAVVHVAPTPAAVSAFVDEKPAAITVSADLYPLQITGDEKIGGGFYYRIEHIIECALFSTERPHIALIRSPDAACSSHGIGKIAVELRKRVFPDDSLLRKPG